MKRIFKYYPQDFGVLPAKVLHMDLNFEVFEKKIIVKSVLHLKALQDIKSLNLDAEDLDFKDVSCNLSKIKWNFDNEDHKLKIQLDSKIKKGTEFKIESNHIVTPTHNVLEGAYFDYTPEGKPQTIITQCQQWGFQRLAPCFDDMTAKCTYTTTIIADKRYTNIITNGDLVQDRVPVGKDKVKMVYENKKTPMAPYLFFLGVGTYRTFRRIVEYPDGDSFTIEILTRPEVDTDVGQKGLYVLHEAIQWIRLFTGPNAVENQEASKKIMSLIHEREKLREQGKNLSKIRKELQKLSSGLHLGYKYTGKTYREIAMQNSNSGGMENVGNTTILANRIVPHPEMSDPAFEYFIRVKCHEFYHNLNGSEVTGMNPFEIWLNEAATVFIEKKHHAYLSGEDYARLEEVLYIVSPDNGVLAEDESAGAVPIEPDGFNDTRELVSNTTYMKAPDFIRMIETVLGEKNFAKGLNDYHTKFRYGNASRSDWINAMQKYTSINLKVMAKQWLKQPKFPNLQVSTNYDSVNKLVKIKTKQVKSDKLWSFPLKIALIDVHGNVLFERTDFINKKEQELTFSCHEKPGLISINRGLTFFGKVIQEQSEEELYTQLRLDDDFVNKHLAFSKIMDREKLRLLRDKKAAVSEKVVDLYFKLLSDKKITDNVGSLLFPIFESVDDDEFRYEYQELFLVRKKIYLAVAKKYENELKVMYREFSKEIIDEDYLICAIKNIKRRQIRNLCIGILAKLDTPEVHAMIRRQYDYSKNASDKLNAFRLYVDSSAKDKYKLIAEVEKVSVKNPVSWEIFLSIMGGNDAADWLDIIKRLEKSPYFKIEQSDHSRPLYCSFAFNKKKSLETKQGRDYLLETILKYSKVNEYNTNRVVQILSEIENMKPDKQADLTRILVEIVKNLDAKKYPSVNGNAKRMLLEMPKARKEYEKRYGKVKI